MCAENRERERIEIQDRESSGKLLGRKRERMNTEQASEGEQRRDRGGIDRLKRDRAHGERESGERWIKEREGAQKWDRENWTDKGLGEEREESKDGEEGERRSKHMDVETEMIITEAKSTEREGERARE